MSLLDYQVNDDITIRDGDYVFVSGYDATAQRLRQKLLLFRGEWFLDQRAGIPWRRDILGQKPRRSILSSLFRQMIEDDPGVVALQSFSLEVDDVSRLLNIDFTARLDDGEQLTVDVQL